MVDFSKVSNNVKKLVADIMKMEGKKKQIDTDREFFALSEALSNSSFTMNKDEIGYIQGLMVEYQEKKFKEAEKGFEENCVTDFTKKEISKIAKRMGDKKKIDSDEEAQALALMLRNTKGDLNSADLCYIQKLLVESGYANYLPQPAVPPVQINVTIVEDQGQKTDVQAPQSTEEATKDTTAETTPGVSADSKPDKAEQRKKRAVPTKPAPKTPKPTPPKKEEPTKPQEAPRPRVSEAARAQGFGIADKIQEELHDTITNNRVIRGELHKVNKENAFSFVGKMIEISDSHTVLGNIAKRVSYSDLKNLVKGLLDQAYAIKANKTRAYSNLKAEYNALVRQIAKDGSKTPDSYDVGRLNTTIKALYVEMSKIYK